MNEQRRDFFKNSALGLATITLGAGLSLVPSAQAEEKPSNTATTAVEKLPEIEAELTLAPNVPKPIERNYPAKVVVKLKQRAIHCGRLEELEIDGQIGRASCRERVLRLV